MVTSVGEEAFFDAYSSGYLTIVASSALFYINSYWLMKWYTPEVVKSSAKREWKWRNITNSLIHSFITGMGACLCFYWTPEMREDLVVPLTLASHLLVSFSIGYFIYDLVDMAVNDRKSKTYELLLHHFMVILCFATAMTQRTYQGYSLMALLVEVNSIFLHIRQIMILTDFSKLSIAYRINNSCNMGTFVVCRILTLGWMSRWLIHHRNDTSSFIFYLCATCPMSVLEEIARNDDLGHPLCGNIREGGWLPNYIIQRFIKHTHLKPLAAILDKEFSLIVDLPVPLRPWGFYTVVSRLHAVLVKRAMSLMPESVRRGNDFCQRLALVSVQMVGLVRSAPLPPLSDSINPPKPKLDRGPDGELRQLTTTLAAGLPHFSSGYMRSWGRDTFISLKGLLLLTNRFDEARFIILGYAGCLRHGLIPNLLDAHGLKPRFNCRDAVWWWLYSIKEYVALAPNGANLLTDKVNRLFPDDDTIEPAFVTQELNTVMQEALATHFQGLCFRERNAGTQIDEHMTSAGFDNQIGVHPVTGFVFGGNEWNCGTWMDKMGSSVEAGTKGRPATPRDGSAVEIVGLSMAVISWLEKAHLAGHYPHGGVTRTNKDGATTSWTWADWSSKIQENFEKEFWVGEDAVGQHVNRRGIYKDSVGASQPWADFRLRPNFTIAMAVAPELFSREKALVALSSAKLLLGPLGMKTLDPSDLLYCGDYDNSNHSADYRVAHGFNYHQGPEWVWPTGYYLLALLRFAPTERAITKSVVEKHLACHWGHIESDSWRGLPELTNSNGVSCRDSCHTQAWSAATILEVTKELER